jgi:hypothetical protein
MPSASTSTLRMPSASISSLSQADDRAILHRRVFHRHQLVKPAFGDDKAADMLAEMPRKAADFGAELQCLDQPPVGRVEADLAQSLDRDAARPPAPKLRRQGGGDVLGQAHGAADLAHRALAPVMDHRGAQPRAMAAIAFVDVLDHLFAAFMFEIDVDVGGLVPGFGNEAFEHHGADLGADRGDTKRIADHRIGRRTAPLAQDAAGARKGDDIVNGQEIGLVVQLFDQAEFAVHHRAHPGGRPGRVTPGQPRSGQPAEPGDRGFVRRQFRGVFIGQLVEREPAARGDGRRPVDRVAMPREDAAHLGLGAQPLFGIGLGGAAERVDGGPGADAGQDIDQPAAPCAMHDRCGRSDGGQAQAAGKIGQPGKAGRVAAIMARRHRQGHVVAKPRDQPAGAGQPAGRGAGGRMQKQHLARAECQQIRRVQVAIALLRPAAAQRQQTAQPAPCSAVLRQGGHRQAVAQHQFRTGDEAREAGQIGRRRARRVRRRRRADAAGSRRPSFRRRWRWRRCPDTPPPRHIPRGGRRPSGR